MEIKIRNRVLDGKWQWLIFLILDINDFLGHPFTFVLDGNLVIKNFKFNGNKLPEGSTKREFAKIVMKYQEENGESNSKT